VSKANVLYAFLRRPAENILTLFMYLLGQTVQPRIGGGGDFSNRQCYWLHIAAIITVPSGGSKDYSCKSSTICKL